VEKRKIRFITLRSATTSLKGGQKQGICTILSPYEGDRGGGEEKFRFFTLRSATTSLEGGQKQGICTILSPYEGDRGGGISKFILSKRGPAAVPKGRYSYFQQLLPRTPEGEVAENKKHQYRVKSFNCGAA